MCAVHAVTKELGLQDIDPALVLDRVRREKAARQAAEDDAQNAPTATDTVA